MSEEQKNNSSEEFCDGCPNHCPKNALKCGRGRERFGLKDIDNDGENSHNRSGHEHHHGEHGHHGHHRDGHHKHRHDE